MAGNMEIIEFLSLIIKVSDENLKEKLENLLVDH